jgi:hypothetical protein
MGPRILFGCSERILNTLGVLKGGTPFTAAFRLAEPLQNVFQTCSRVENFPGAGRNSLRWHAAAILNTHTTWQHRSIRFFPKWRFNFWHGFAHQDTFGIPSELLPKALGTYPGPINKLIISLGSGRVLEVFRRCSGGVLADVFWRCSEGVLEVSWRTCSGGVPEVSWRHPGVVLGK